jgi:aminopeptidase
MTAIEGTILGKCLGLAAHERCVVLSDEGQFARGLALYREALRLGAESALILQEPPTASIELGAAAIATFAVSDVIVSVLPGSISHSGATRTALTRGARVVSMGASTGEMLTRLLGCDLQAVAARSRRLAHALTSASQARLTCPLGTDLEIDLEGRSGIADDGDLRASGSLGNMPFGEGFIAPPVARESSFRQLSPARGASQSRLSSRCVAASSQARTAAQQDAGSATPSIAMAPPAET